MLKTSAIFLCYEQSFAHSQNDSDWSDSNLPTEVRNRQNCYYSTGSSFEQLHICLRSSTHKRRQVENQVRLQFSSTSALIIIPVFGKNSKSDYLCQNKWGQQLLTLVAWTFSRKKIVYQMCLCQIRLPRLNKDHKDQATVKRAKKGKCSTHFVGQRSRELWSWVIALYSVITTKGSWSDGFDNVRSQVERRPSKRSFSWLSIVKAAFASAHFVIDRIEGVGFYLAILPWKIGGGQCWSDQCPDWR